ncbi:MAG: Ig-like domain-containing protein, partial [Candidatus Liptonbacteria bacterium]|nr:Ig-like domain-containing protein [Candidatus Liptonbacteria bacterium]
TAPTVSITNPLPSATVSGTVLITASASDNIGVTSVRFILDGTPLGLSVTAPPYQVFWNTLTSGNGSHTLRAIAQDAAGNTANSQTITVTVQNIPYVSLVSPTDDSTLSDTAILLANATNSIAHVQFVLDGLDYGPQIGAPPYQIFWNTLASSNGSHTLRAKAQDLGGNQSISSQITVTVANDGNFVIGDRVRVVRPAKVHSTPSLSSGTVLGMQKKGALGTVTEGPVTVDRYKWWKVDFDASVTDGWVQGRYLANQQ